MNKLVEYSNPIRIWYEYWNSLASLSKYVILLSNTFNMHLVISSPEHLFYMLTLSCAKYSLILQYNGVQ